MRLWRKLWRDEGGAVLSAEAVLLGTVLAVGATAGVRTASESLRGEFSEMAYAIRSLDQSYEFQGHSGCGCWTAGSCFRQRPVEESLAELRAYEEKERQIEKKKEEERQKAEEGKPEVKPKKKQLKPKAKPETDEEAAESVRFELNNGSIEL